MPQKNGPVHVEFSIMRNVMASATKAELGVFFVNFQNVTSIRTALSKIGHPQPPTPVSTDNTAENSIMNGTAKHKKIQSNRHDMLLGTLQNTKKSFPYIMGRRKEKLGILFHQTSPDLAPQNYATNIFETNKKRQRKLKGLAKWNQTRVCWNCQPRGNPKTG